MNKLVQIALVIVFLLCVHISLAQPEDSDASKQEEGTLSLQQIKKFPIRKLQELLKKKGIECKGCSEKSEYVNKVFESQDLPDVEEKIENNSPSEKSGFPGEGEKIDQDMLNELLRRSQWQRNMENMSPEEIARHMQEQNGFNFGKNPKPKGKKSKETKEKLKDKPKRTVDTSDAETVEL